MFNIGIKPRIASVLAGAAFLLTGGSAFASYNVASRVISTDTWGNDRFYAKYRYQTDEASYGSALPASAARTTMAGQQFYVTAKMLSKSITAVDWEAVGVGDMKRIESGAPVYSDKVALKAVMIGDEMYNQPLRDIGCPNAPPTESCVAYNRNFSKTLFSKSQTFMVSFVPVTVSGKLMGGVTTSASAIARAAAIAGKADSLKANAKATLGVSAYLDSVLEAFAGIDDVLAVGVTAKIRLIEAGLSSNTESNQSATGSNILIVHTNEMPLTLRSLSGKVDVWADITPWITERTNLISWNGYSWSKTLSGFKNVISAPAP